MLLFLLRCSLAQKYFLSTVKSAAVLLILKTDQNRNQSLVLQPLYNGLFSTWSQYIYTEHRGRVIINYLIFLYLAFYAFNLAGQRELVIAEKILNDKNKCGAQLPAVESLPSPPPSLTPSLTPDKISVVRNYLQQIINSFIDENKLECDIFKVIKQLEFP